MNEYNEMGKGGKSGSDGFREKGKVEKKAPAYKEGPNPNVSVPKLPQIKGVTEQG
jgi:hypothetical protein